MKKVMKKLMISLSLILMMFVFSCKKQQESYYQDAYCWVCYNTIQQFPYVCNMTQKDIDDYMYANPGMKCYTVNSDGSPIQK